MIAAAGPAPAAEAAPAPIESAPALAARVPQEEVASIAAPASRPAELPASSVAVLDPNTAALASMGALPVTGGGTMVAGAGPAMGPPLVAILAVITGLGMWALSFLRVRRRP
jgi:hypothetical protein